MAMANGFCFWSGVLVWLIFLLVCSSLFVPSSKVGVLSGREGVTERDMMLALCHVTDHGHGEQNMGR